MDRIEMAGHLIRRLHQQSTQTFQAGMQAIGVDMTSVQFAALDAIAEQIDAGRPIGLCIDWTAGGGHFVVVDGYDLETGQIDVKDPLFGPSVVEDASFPASYQGGGTWSWTYLTRK